MKNLSTFCACFLLVGSALAQTGGGYVGQPATTNPGGFTGPLNVVTAEHAKTLKDHTKVTLQGTIQSHIGGEDYIFKDESGTIEVEIEHHRWAGQTVSAKDRVEIFGEVDKDWNSVTIEVKRIRKL